MIALAICNAFGGTGKTTTAVSLAAALAERKRVLLVDLDPRGCAASSLGLEPDAYGTTLADVLAQQAEPHDAIYKTPLPGLDVMPAGVDLPMVEHMLRFQQDPETGLVGILCALEGYDRVVIDLPSHDGLMAALGLVAADRVLVPVPATFLGVEGAKLQVQALARTLSEFNPSLRFEGALPTMYVERSQVARMVLRVLTQTLGAELVFPPIDLDLPLAEAPCYGEPIQRFAPASAGAAQYRHIARALESRWTRRAMPLPSPAAPFGGQQAA